MESVLGRWKSLSITEEEAGVIGVEDVLIEKGKGLRQFLLLGRLLTRKPYNREAFKRTMASLWRIDKGNVTRSAERDTFLFSFEIQKERDRVVSMEPWHFENGLVVLKSLGAEDPIDWAGWNRTSFWIQLWNIPHCGMIRDIGEVLGKGFGRCTSVDSDESGRCRGPAMRVRVEMDISKPLRRGAQVRLGDIGGVVWVGAKYERLPDFCFGCGKIGHVLRDCLEIESGGYVAGNKS